MFTAGFENESFQFISQIRNLDISTCKIQQINQGALTMLKNITYLDVSNNTCLKFEGLENITSDLQFSNIKILKANNLHKISDLTKVLKKTSHIKDLKNTSLEYAFVDGNRLQTIEKTAISYLPKSLKFVSLRGNPLKFGLYIFEVFLLVNLETADVSDLFRHKTDLHPENAFSDSIYTCKEDSVIAPKYMDPSDVDYIYVHDESSERDIPDLFSPAVVPIPNNLKHVNYSSASLRMDIPKSKLSGNKLEMIDFSNNILYALNGPIYNVESLKILNVSTNFCSNISKFFFSSDFKNLEHLNFHNNLLGIVLPDDIDGEIFHNLESLIELVLSKNRIPNLPRIYSNHKEICKNLI
ncbi:unnamed protein product [Mytilus edulis]|uniref:Uncharacterized protein n=1 Tax=Mytilus edulis TaxID=6550 RepID=A0A8S3SCM4_MYTED|nr:unnamed protein product [Mytilus edulis]